ncbi:5-hydroxytryptamine receptor 2A [Caerostris extrusa]|uniref:5-hydroxytryptamine receptor 2A n=1 Tax=Caerostris extrusa TaxID=172846 RepID=A0AAV4TYA0_CAEEX|nr:5-hydroxytryptamine receptor 2A [Caerostris extrusa]
MEIFPNETYDDFSNFTNTSMPLDNYDNRSIYLSDSQVNDNLLESPPLLLQPVSVATAVCLAILLGIVILTTVVGNLFVLAAIIKERNLQTVSNYLVFSLAIADLMVACLVMPMGAQYEVMNQQWVLGATLCELWTSADVLCCTASILHLVAIAVDRFRAVTSIDYVQHRSERKVGFMIALVWGVAFLVSFAPILGWKDDKFLFRIQEEKSYKISLFEPPLVELNPSQECAEPRKINPFPSGTKPHPSVVNPPFVNYSGNSVVKPREEDANHIETHDSNTACDVSQFEVYGVPWPPKLLAESKSHGDIKNINKADRTQIWILSRKRSTSRMQIPRTVFFSKNDESDAPFQVDLGHTCSEPPGSNAPEASIIHEYALSLSWGHPERK